MRPDPSTDHDFNAYGVCTKCGCGRSAAGRPCEPGARLSGGRDPRERRKSEQDPDGTHPKRSILLGSLAGYAIASALGVVVVIGLVIIAGRFEAGGAFRVLAAAGGVGAAMGYTIGARRGEARGARTLTPGSKFILALGIMMAVIAGSGVITVLILFAYDAIAGKGG
jgi:hypothetical protein